MKAEEDAPVLQERTGSAGEACIFVLGSDAIVVAPLTAQCSEHGEPDSEIEGRGEGEGKDAGGQGGACSESMVTFTLCTG